MAKVVVIGAGHNGLVTACYLAKAGHCVTVVEKRPVVGGCCTTDETLWPGYKVSSVAYVNSLFSPQIVEDLCLQDHGYEVLKREPSSFTPFPDGQFLFLGADREFNKREIGKFSTADAERYPQYEAMLDKVARFPESLLTMTPPNCPPYRWRDWMSWAKVAMRFAKLGPKNGYQFSKLMLKDARKFLDDWFESDALKATLLTDATIGTQDFPGYNLLHHVLGEAGGARGVWGYQRGGMGGLTQALAKAAKEMGVNIRTNCRVEGIELINRDKKVRGVEGWESETTNIAIFDRSNRWRMSADVVVSNADPNVTFLKLLPTIAVRNRRLIKLQEKVSRLDFSHSSTMKVNLKLSGLPRFKCLIGTEYDNLNPGPQHQGTIHLSPSVEYISRAAAEGIKGLPSFYPMLEITIPSAVDKTVAPAGKHLMNILVQYAPYNLRNIGSNGWRDLAQEYFEKRIKKVMQRYIANIDDIIEGVQILTPEDLEREYSLTGGSLFHGAMDLWHLFSGRPVRGWADYRTPVRGLYLCGSGTHPGGGVTGACGYNAAREILNDLGGVTFPIH